MATPTQISRFRSRIGDPGTVFSNADIDEIFVEAYELYQSAPDDLAFAAAMRIGIEQLLANAAKRANYTQNESSESAGQVFTNLLALRTLWSGRVEELAGASSPAVDFRPFKKTQNPTEYPNA